jgi:hypothetical protein
MSTQKHHRIQGAYRNQDFAIVIRCDQATRLWTWNGTVEFDAGSHSLSSNRSFVTAEEAEEHMRQSIYRCIDNRLGG